MKKSDITKIFEGATEEQVNQILNLHNSEISSANTERDQYKNDLDAANQKLTGFEGVDVNALNQQIQELQNQLAEEKAVIFFRLHADITAKLSVITNRKVAVVLIDELLSHSLV